jgi:hypothetical protein
MSKHLVIDGHRNSNSWLHSKDVQRHSVGVHEMGQVVKSTQVLVSRAHMLYQVIYSYILDA